MHIDSVKKEKKKRTVCSRLKEMEVIANAVEFFFLLDLTHKCDIDGQRKLSFTRPDLHSNVQLGETRKAGFVGREG